MLQGKNVLLGITASIAAYKSAFLCRELVKVGANVRVLMTPDSVNFITPLTLSTLSKNPVFSAYFNPESGEWNNHVELAKWADLMLIAPLTANSMAKMANGICDNLLLATYFSMENPVYFAPAMDLDMYKHSTVSANINKLISFGNTLIPPGIGELASGLMGEGRMAEPNEILDVLNANKGKWGGKKVLITAGPTFESIDPVRYIGNRSSGKMGIALAEGFRKFGADVTLIHGPISLPEQKGIHFVEIESAQEMFEKVKLHSESADVIIMAAAVADYTPKKQVNQKIKKKEENLSIELTSTVDILKWLGDNKKSHQFLMGFALETNNEIENATKKLVNKRLDLIALNSLNDIGAGFGYDTNQITLIDKNNNLTLLKLDSKKKIAKGIIDKIEQLNLKS